MAGEGEPAANEVRLQEEIRALKSELQGLRDQWDSELARIFREMALDRQRLTRLEHPEDGEPTHAEQAHLQKIERHLQASPRHAASFAEIRGLLGVSPGRVSQLVKKLDLQRFEVKRSASDHKARVLVLKRRSSF